MAKTILYISEAKNYFKGITKIIKKQVGPSKSLIYITTNKPANHVESVLKESRINVEDIFFIDCITKTIGTKFATELENVFYLESPHAMTGLGLTINLAIKHLPGKKVLLLDSLSTLLIYNNDYVIGRFCNFIINKMRLSDIGVILIVLSSDADSKVINTIESFVDEVIQDGK